MCFVWISEQTAIISLYNINLSVCILEEESVYHTVQTGSLNQTDTVSPLQVNLKNGRLPYNETRSHNCSVYCLEN